MKKFSILLSLAMVVALSSCDYQKNNTIKQQDVREGDSWVYGPGLDSTAVQLKVKYTSNPDLEKRTDAIKVKLYGKS